MRKSTYLKLSENKDKDSFGILFNCRHVSKEQLNQIISQNRINSYLKEKLIEKIDTQNETVYRLTEKGYREGVKQLNIDHYRYHSSSISHDLGLSDKYLSLLKTGKEFSWKNEEDLKQERWNQLQGLLSCGRFEEYERLYLSSVPDAIYSIGGIELGFDVITDNYSNAQIISKVSFCHDMGLQLEISKV